MDELDIRAMIRSTTLGRDWMKVIIWSRSLSALDHGESADCLLTTCVRLMRRLELTRVHMPRISSIFLSRSSSASLLNAVVIRSLSLISCRETDDSVLGVDGSVSGRTASQNGPSSSSILDTMVSPITHASEVSISVATCGNLVHHQMTGHSVWHEAD